MGPIQIWALYYASLVSFTLHPGYQKPGTPMPTLSELADLADKMMAETEKRYVSWQQ